MKCYILWIIDICQHEIFIQLLASHRVIETLEQLLKESQLILATLKQPNDENFSLAINVFFSNWVAAM